MKWEQCMHRHLIINVLSIGTIVTFWCKQGLIILKAELLFSET